MVRFIIIAKEKDEYMKKNIYIPIWLDLLLLKLYSIYKSVINLHSNMVRFIIDELNLEYNDRYLFTFQYG